ncbi:MAG: hypothetical protein V1746_04835 [bacterium]
MATKSDKRKKALEKQAKANASRRAEAKANGKETEAQKRLEIEAAQNGLTVKQMLASSQEDTVADAQYALDAALRQYRLNGKSDLTAKNLHEAACGLLAVQKQNVTEEAIAVVLKNKRVSEEEIARMIETANSSPFPTLENGAPVEEEEKSVLQTQEKLEEVDENTLLERYTNAYQNFVTLNARANDWRFTRSIKKEKRERQNAEKARTSLIQYRQAFINHHLPPEELDKHTISQSSWIEIFKEGAMTRSLTQMQNEIERLNSDINWDKSHWKLLPSEIKELERKRNRLAKLEETLRVTSQTLENAPFFFSTAQTPSQVKSAMVDIPSTIRAQIPTAFRNRFEAAEKEFFGPDAAKYPLTRKAMLTATYADLRKAEELFDVPAKDRIDSVQLPQQNNYLTPPQSGRRLNRFN